VVDTNIWISFLLGRSLDSLINSIKSRQIEIFFSPELYDELFNVITRQKFKPYFTDIKIAEINEIISRNVKNIEPDCIITDCRDPKDNFLLELAVSAQADYLITGDSDLLALDPFHNVRIIKARDFEEIMKSI